MLTSFTKLNFCFYLVRWGWHATKSTTFKRTVQKWWLFNYKISSPPPNEAIQPWNSLHPHGPLPASLETASLLPTQWACLFWAYLWVGSCNVYIRVWLPLLSIVCLRSSHIVAGPRTLSICHPPASISPVLGRCMCTIMPRKICFKKEIYIAAAKKRLAFSWHTIRHTMGIKNVPWVTYEAILRALRCKNP